MSAMAIGSIVSYQGRCWLVTRVLGSWLHIVTATGPAHYHGIDVPRAEVSNDMKATESGHVGMYCSFKQK
jgi:hypothetical protein